MLSDFLIKFVLSKNMFVMNFLFIEKFIMNLYFVKRLFVQLLRLSVQMY